jgi:hypothetical protein
MQRDEDGRERRGRVVIPASDRKRAVVRARPAAFINTQV